MFPLLLSGFAVAGPVEDGLKTIDAALKSHGGERVVVSEGSDFCGPEVLGPPEVLENRGDLCRDSERAGLWRLRDLAATGGERVAATMGVRRYPSPEAAERAWRMTLARLGGGRRTLAEGATAWCYADAIWTGELLWTLEYGCNVSVPHVAALGAVQEALRGLGEPHHGAIGVFGSHSGHGWLLDAAGREHAVSPADRWWTYAKVVGVSDDDVLWIRDASPTADGSLGEKVSSLEAGSSCVPVLSREGGWWRTVGRSAAGWASARYLEEATAECSR